MGDITVLMRLVIIFVAWVICGVVTSAINKMKGYDGGFWWGFFLGLIGILIVTFRDDNSDTIMDVEQVSEDNEMFLDEHDGWECPCCFRSHGVLEKSCVCDFSLNDETDGSIVEENEEIEDMRIKVAESKEELISQYKKMCEGGFITEEEFGEKKKKILEI